MLKTIGIDWLFNPFLLLSHRCAYGRVFNAFLQRNQIQSVLLGPLTPETPSLNVL